jgi:hypothetical protein
VRIQNEERCEDAASREGGRRGLTRKGHASPQNGYKGGQAHGVPVG